VSSPRDGPGLLQPQLRHRAGGLYAHTTLPGAQRQGCTVTLPNFTKHKTDFKLRLDSEESKGDRDSQ